MASIEGCILVFPMEDSRSAVDLESLVETYAALLFRVAHSVLRNRAEAEDAVQDTFIRVLEHRRSLPAVRNMRVWLVRIAWNLALDRRRRARPEQLDEAFARTLAAAHLPADDALSEAQSMQSVLIEIERLPKAERQAILLSALEELSIPEIAEVMRKSESAIRALLFRARARLRERLERKR